MDVENRRSILLLENDSMDVMQFGIRIDDSIIVPPIFDLIALEIFKSDFFYISRKQYTEYAYLPVIKSLSFKEYGKI